MNIPFALSPSLLRKCETLAGAMSSCHRPAIAYSGGVDSTFLTWFVREVLNLEPLAFLMITPLQSERERTNALHIAEELGFSLETMELDPTVIPLVRENSTRRCYFCKKELMGRIKARAGELKCSVVLDGTHTGDGTAYRPGKKALVELGILSPLSLAGFAKNEIREMSRLAKLPTWNKPSQSCLATRIPYDTPITRDLLTRIEQAEELLWDLGCVQVRVRFHGELARIEVHPVSFSIILEAEARERIQAHFRRLGFVHVSLDLAGYHSGCWDAEERTGCATTREDHS